MRGSSVSLYLVGKSCHRSRMRPIDTHRNPCAREKRFGKKRKIRMIEVVSINVKRPHALLECKEMLIRNVSRDQYFVQS